jgi:hypothetical protein
MNAPAPVKPPDPATKLSDRVAAFVAASIIFMVAGVAISLLLRAVPIGNETIIGQLQGALWTSLGVIVNYYFGTSATQRKKDDTISNALTSAANPSITDASNPAVVTTTTTKVTGDTT